MATEIAGTGGTHPNPTAPNAEPRTFAVPGAPTEGIARTGIVFVHGIGTQVARETLFDWARPILDVLAEWRREYDETRPHHTIGENPVSAASVVDPANPWIEVDIPAFAHRERMEWLFTEAYWAGDVRAPSFADAARYLFRRIPGVVRGITSGYGVREDRRKKRLARLIEANEHSDDPKVRARVDDLRRSLSGRWRITEILDGVWQVPLVRTLLALIATIVALAVLAIYTFLHAIPIDAVRRKVDITLADTFIVEWFGDLPIILDDQPQSAAIRTRLLQRVRWLHEQGCEDVVIVAHSGGTIVSYATLLRYRDDEFRVAKLITLGEAIKLGWRLEQETRDWLPGNTIRGDVKATHPDLRWVDIWASYDPAPSGPLHEIAGCPLVAVERLSDLPDDPRIHVESRPVTNFMHLALDHGGYWQNDEGFLIPVIRHIDDPRGDGTESRFYRNALDRTVRTERRIRRVAILLAWRWTALGFGIAALVAAVLRSDLHRTGDSVAGLFALLPGHEIVTGTVNGVGNAVSVVFNAIGWDSVPQALAAAGPVILGGLVPVLAVFAIYRRGILSWAAHDAIERKKIRREDYAAPGERSARSECVLLVGGLVGVVLAALVVSLTVLVGWLVVVAIVGYVTRRVTWF
jgi:pimeloyl-ACP methyl ester carboxylesterase